MNIFVISFEKLFTYNLLLYSWNFLKKNKQLYNDSREITFPGVSKCWLERVAFLISQGKFNYKSFTITNSSNSKKRIKSILKLKIIENAFALLLVTYLRASLTNNNIDLIKYLRFNTNLYLCVFLS